MSEEQTARPGFLLLALLVVWGISILNLAFFWVILLSDQKEFHFHLLTITVLVAATIPFIIIIWRLRFNNLCFSKPVMISLIALWEIFLVGVIIYWALTAISSHHMSLERAASLKENFNNVFVLHIVTGCVLMIMGCKRKTS